MTDRAAKARATRTASKHDRWIEELREFGWSIVQAGNITVRASVLLHPVHRSSEPHLHLWCLRCDMPVVEHTDPVDVEVPLPKVLHAVNSHICEAGSWGA